MVKKEKNLESVRFRFLENFSFFLKKENSWKVKKLKLASLSLGFTLLELLVVMAVIGVLAGFFVSNYPAQIQRSRDARRKSELKQYQAALESYANQNRGFYPMPTLAFPLPADVCPNSSDGVVPAQFLCAPGQPLRNFQPCPGDPLAGQTRCSDNNCQYCYVPSPDGSEYGLWTYLERPQNPSTPIFVICSRGLSGESSSEPKDNDVCASLTP